MAALPPQIQRALNTCQKILQAKIVSQTPVDTGRLKRSMKVTAYTKRSGDLAFQINSGPYQKYGRYVDLGTGPYRANKRGKFNARPAKGKGGIIPRFFTTIDKITIDRVKAIMRKAYADYIKFELKRAKLKVK
jgi:HK97 gp10 family phage protein